MLQKLIIVVTTTFLLAACSSTKPLAGNNTPQTPADAKETKKEVRFLDISSSDNTHRESASTIKEEHLASLNQPVTTGNDINEVRHSPVEKSSPLQVKYSELLNTDAAQIQNIFLYQTIDDWYGTRYKLGGTTKSGIDCSAFVQTIFASVFGVSLPRMARDQYKVTRRISRTELQEGDLLFFNTRGGVSHVGIYLQNNKFVHASVSGVMISDMFEPYYVKHFISAGRVRGVTVNTAISANP